MTSVKISLGELVDKLSILEIKKNKIDNQEKLTHVNKEYDELVKHVKLEEIPVYKNLIHVNSIIWNVEDSLHQKEVDKTFDDEFVKLARLAYSTNDIRFELKNEINKSSELKEQKGYKETKTPKPDLVIIPHQGIGDLMITNGIIRHYSEKHRVIIGIRPDNTTNAQFMFRDIHDLAIFTAVNDEQLRYIATTQLSHIPRIGLGYFNAPNCWGPFPHGHFAQIFYTDAGLDYECMYSKFFVLRDFQREQALYDAIVKHLGTDKYIIIHDDPSRGLNIDESLVECPEGVAKMYIGKNRIPIQGETIFDYRMVLEKCVAFHGFNSNIPFLIDLWKIPVDKKFLHLYPRKTDNKFVEDYLKPGWVSIDKPTT